MTQETAVLKRPDGNKFLVLSWLTLGASVLLFAFSFGVIEYDYEGQATLQSIGIQWAMQVIAGGLFSLFLVLLVTGSLIRALYFVDGVAEKAAATD